MAKTNKTVKDARSIVEKPTKPKKSRKVKESKSIKRGTRRELLSLLKDREFGWCVSDHILYIKMGNSLKVVAVDRGGDIEGLSRQAIIRKKEGKESRHTVSFEGVVEDAELSPFN